MTKQKSDAQVLTHFANFTSQDATKVTLELVKQASKQGTYSKARKWLSDLKSQLPDATMGTTEGAIKALQFSIIEDAIAQVNLMALARPFDDTILK